MLYSKKGKRKITVNGEIYYWCVTVDKDTGIEPIFLRVFSDSKYLFSAQFEYENKRWEYISEHTSLYGRTLILGEAPQITPRIVRECIMSHLNTHSK